MITEKELFYKFPAVLQNKLLSGEIEFPSATQYTYDKIYTYRAVERSSNDRHDVTLEDFKSYYDLKKVVKKARGLDNYNIEKDPKYYGASSFLKKEIVEQLMKFPNPRKKMAAGYVYCEGGPQLTEDQHVCWWLFDGTDVSGFKILEGNEDE